METMAIPAINGRIQSIFNTSPSNPPYSPCYLLKPIPKAKQPHPKRPNLTSPPETVKMRALF
jgi:hypothetical protein